MTQEQKGKEWDGFIGWHKCSEALKRKIIVGSSTPEQTLVLYLLNNSSFCWKVYDIARVYDDTGYVGDDDAGNPISIGEDELTGRERVICDYFTVPFYRKHLMEKITKKLEGEAYEISRSFYELKKAQGLEKKWWDKK